MVHKEGKIRTKTTTREGTDNEVMDTAGCSNENMEEQNNTQDTQQQERSTRWDKAQKKKESGRIKKQQAALSITSTRSRTIANSRNIDTDLQGEIVSLVIKNPKDIIKGQGKTIVNKDNRTEDIDPGVHEKNRNQDIDNSIHKQPDLNPAPADTRDEYDEVFHDVKFMETKVETINRGEERIAQSDDKLTRVNINSEYQEMDLHRRKDQRTYGDIYEVPKRPEAEMRTFEDNCPSLQSSEKCSRQWCTSQCITDDDSNMLTAIPTIQEIRDRAFDMDKDSVPGPDGLSGYF
ncbi:hypothetical protein H5410_061524 [Solanum commersonii]|uniref:Uncharacterized protein n=1 Tax=Solanum commersonii TaxID=4109 RepID=A0A9J5W9X6_SOLCO|nr:hypothetical protein H5410_061524 [Solanum commersonii]